MDNPFGFLASNLRHQTRFACGLIPLLNMLRDRGVDEEQFLAQVGIRKFELIDPAFTIDFEQEIRLAERALDILTDPAAPLELARYYHLHNFSFLGLAMRACSTLGESFQLITSYPRLQWGVCETSASVEGSVITFMLHAGQSRIERFLLVRDMGCVKTMSDEALQAPLNLIDVRFSFPAPDDTTVYEEFFGCPVKFGEKISGLRFSVDELERKFPTADPLSKEFNEAQCARLSSEIDEPFRYAWLVRDHLLTTTPVPSLEELSQKLKIEPRTLQRYLKKEGETFSDILREVRLRRATDRLLYTSMNMEEIAVELGFSDAVALSHAFKQWTGMSPRQWRADNRV